MVAAAAPPHLMICPYRSTRDVRELRGSPPHGQLAVRSSPTHVSETTILYRPVGQYELQLIVAANYRAFPRRLPHQPIFYPVLTEAYAMEIARDWNTKDAASGYMGYVTRFAVDSAFAARYPVQVAGARRHQELWIPATDLPAFNDHLVGPIEVIAEFRGAQAEVWQAAP
jgi:hypothetical protein